MKIVLVAVLSLETMPLAILLGAAWDRSQRRPPGFWMRFTGFLVCVTFPELVLIGGSAVGLVGEGAAVDLLWGGFVWGLALTALAPLLLFRGPGSTPGSSDDAGGGPGPSGDRPSPAPPIGGIPLPDAEQSSTRARGPHPPRRAPNRRRPAHEPERAPSRVRQMMLPDRPLR